MSSLLEIYFDLQGFPRILAMQQPLQIDTAKTTATVVQAHTVIQVVKLSMYMIFLFK